MKVKEESANFPRPFPLKNSLLFALGFVLFKILIFATAYYSVLRDGLEPNIHAFDAAYYRDIVTFGYVWREGQQGVLAFFPLFPALVKIILKIFPFLSFDSVAVGMNLAFYFSFCVLFQRWVWQTGLKLYWLPALLLTLDRYSLWATIPYTEPLFLNLIMIFLLILRKYPLEMKGRYILAALVGGMASATRIVGVALIAALGCAHFKWFLKRPIFGALCLFLGVSGVLVYFGYVHVTLGSWDMSLRTTATWNRHFSLLGFFNTLYYLFKQFYFPTILTFALSLWAIFRTPKGLKLEPTEKWLMAWLIFIPMSNTIPVGVSRYFSVLIFGPLMLAYILENYKNKSFVKYFRGLVAVVFLSEIYWQVYLLQKFFKSEVFSWAA